MWRHNMSFLNKYAPQSLSEVVIANDINHAQLLNVIDEQSGTPILLHGPYGTGKSTIAQILPKELFPNQSLCTDILTIKADPRKDFKAKISSLENFIGCMPFADIDKRFVIIDEFDNFNKDLQKTLKGTFDTYANSCRLILTSNHISNIDAGIIDRCLVLEIKNPSPRQWLPMCKRIFLNEGQTWLGDDMIHKVIEDCISGREVMKKIEELINAIKYKRTVYLTL